MRDNYLNARELKQIWDMKATVIATVSGALSSHQRILIGTGDHPNYSIVEIDQNTKKSAEDLTRLVTQTPLENHQLTLV